MNKVGLNAQHIVQYRSYRSVKPVDGGKSTLCIVNEMKKYASKLSVTADQRLQASIDLFFLKLQHMEKRKYITANDFFPINYAMLYNMGAAIITHMMIILQFQQWEENQKLATPTFDNDTFA